MARKNQIGCNWNRAARRTSQRPRRTRAAGAFGNRPRSADAHIRALAQHLGSSGRCGHPRSNGQPDVGGCVRKRPRRGSCRWAGCRAGTTSAITRPIARRVSLRLATMDNLETGVLTWHSWSLFYFARKLGGQAQEWQAALKECVVHDKTLRFLRFLV